ncbi:MAG: hypothetical protein R6V23_04155 [Bacteroidales bacterium]
MENKILRSGFIAIAFLFMLFQIKPVSAQYCDRFHETSACRLANDGSFKPYGQSKSGVLEINKKFEYKLVLYGEKDFKIGVCTESGFGPVHFKIINARSKTVLYDNITDDYIESVGFTNDFTQSVIIEITVLAEEIEPEDAYDTRVCVGINILWRKAPKIGF